MRSIDEIRHDLPSLSDVPFIHDLPSVSDVTDMVSRLDPRQRRRRSKTPWIIGIVAVRRQRRSPRLPARRLSRDDRRVHPRVVHSA